MTEEEFDMQTKRILNTFLQYDIEGIQNYLKKKSLQGQHLLGVKWGFWIFEKAGPKAFEYLYTYENDISIYVRYNESQIEKLIDEYLKDGWILVSRIGRRCIFKREINYDLEETSNEALNEPQLKPTIFKKVYQYYKSHENRSTWMVLFVAFLQIAMQVNRYQRMPLNFLADSISIYLLITWIMLMFSSICALLNFYIWAYRSQKMISKLGFVIAKPLKILQAIRIASLCLATVSLALTFEALLATEMSIKSLFWSLSIAVVGAILYFSQKKLIQCKFSKEKILGIQIVMAIVLTGFVFIMMGKSIANDFRQSRADAVHDEIFTLKTQYGRDIIWYVDHENIPVDIKSYLPNEVETQYYTDDVEQSKSLLHHFLFVSQKSFDYANNSDMPAMTYTILESKITFISNNIWQKLLSDIYFEGNYNFQYDKGRDVLRKKLSESEMQFLFRHDNRIILLTLNWELSDEDFKAIKDQLIEVNLNKN